MRARMRMHTHVRTHMHTYRRSLLGAFSFSSWAFSFSSWASKTLASALPAGNRFVRRVLTKLFPAGSALAKVFEAQELKEKAQELKEKEKEKAQELKEKKREEEV